MTSLAARRRMATQHQLCSGSRAQVTPPAPRQPACSTWKTTSRDEQRNPRPHPIITDAGKVRSSRYHSNRLRQAFVGLQLRRGSRRPHEILNSNCIKISAFEVFVGRDRQLQFDVACFTRPRYSSLTGAQSDPLRLHHSRESVFGRCPVLNADARLSHVSRLGSTGVLSSGLFLHGRNFASFRPKTCRAIGKTDHRRHKMAR